MTDILVYTEEQDHVIAGSVEPREIVVAVVGEVGGGSGGGGGAVDSVNGQLGHVVLDAADVGADAAGTATSAVAAHTGAADPHPQYLTGAEGDAAYDASGAATSAVAAHVAASDPHPQYTTQSEGDARYERGLTAGTNITIDRTNPAAPVISASGGGGGGGAVDSVNGQTGVVVLDTDDIAEGVSNLYFTNGRAAAAAPVQTVDGQAGAVSLSSSYAPLSHVGAGGAAHSNAVAAGAAGFMTGADKTKLDGIAAGATQNSSDAVLLARANHTGTQTASTISDFASASRAQTEAELVAGTNVTITPSGSGATRQLTIAAAGGGGSTNLSTTTSTTTLTVNSDTGTDAVLPAATPSVAGVLTAADKTKLDGVAVGATANANTDSLAEGATNKYFTEGRVRSTVLTGLSLLTGGVISAADSVLSALGKLQKQISDAVTAIGGKQDTLVSGTSLKTVNGNSLLGAGDLAISGSGMSNPMTAEGDIIVGSTSGTPNRLGKGAALQVLRVNSAGTALEYADPATGGGALTNLSEAKNTASPNASIPVVSLSASVTESSGDLALIPKQNGALLLQIPNGLSAGGAKRGIHAIDLQRVRVSASQVASGQESVLISGENCTASGTRSTIINGWYGTASGSGSGIYSGFNNKASANYATVMGGYENVANGEHSSISGGSYATARLIYGAEARASGSFAVVGDAQRERFILRRATADATATVLSADQAAPESTNQVTLPNNGTYDFSIRVVARAGNADHASFRITGLVTRGASAGTIAIVGTPTVTIVAASPGASSWSVAVSANTAIGCLAVTVTGAAATSIKWVADVETVEVVG